MSRQFLTTPHPPGKKAPSYGAISPREAWVLEKPDYYTAFSFRGRGKSVKKDNLPTKQAAYAEARRLRADSDRGVLIYAVRGDAQALVGSVD